MLAEARIGGYVPPEVCGQARAAAERLDATRWARGPLHGALSERGSYNNRTSMQTVADWFDGKYAAKAIDLPFPHGTCKLLV